MFPLDFTKHIFKEQSSALLLCWSRVVIAKVIAFVYVSRVFPYPHVYHIAVTDREFHLHFLLNILQSFCRAS